ncbi:MAG: hypothetical protein HFJ79_05070 [Clostridiales bacterium]|nr:hypothetical protein [Clostridiales bacterium]
MNSTNIHIPSISSIDKALEIYYRHSEIGNKEMTTLFGKHSTATINRLKQLVKSEMAVRGIRSYCAYSINTKLAFEVWGIDVDDLEKRRGKLLNLGL